MSIEPFTSNTPTTAVAFSVSNSGDNTVISGKPNYIIRVLTYRIAAAAPVNITAKDGAGTVIDGPMSASANWGFTDPFVPTGNLADCAPGEDFVISLDGAVQVGGRVVYQMIKTS